MAKKAERGIGIKMSHSLKKGSVGPLNHGCEEVLPGL